MEYCLRRKVYEVNNHQDFTKWTQLAQKFLGDDFWSGMMEMIPGSDIKVDVYHSQNEVIVLVDLPGIRDMNQIDLRIEGDELLIKGQHTSPYEYREVILNERPKGSFERKIKLGALVTKQNSTARYRKGVLEIRLLKVNKSGSQRIQIRDF